MITVFIIIAALGFLVAIASFAARSSVGLDEDGIGFGEQVSFQF